MEARQKQEPVERGGRIDLTQDRDTSDADDRVDQAIAESFPASDPPSWTLGIDHPRHDSK